eukprot:gene14612-8020_t
MAMDEAAAWTSTLMRQLHRRDRVVNGFARVLSAHARLKVHTNRVAQETADVEADVTQLRAERVGLIATRDASVHQSEFDLSNSAESKGLSAKISALTNKKQLLTAQLLEAHKQTAEGTEQQLGLHRQVNALEQALTEKTNRMQILTARCARLEESNLQIKDQIQQGDEVIQALNAQRTETSETLNALREELRASAGAAAFAAAALAGGRGGGGGGGSGGGAAAASAAANFRGGGGGGGGEGRGGDDQPLPPAPSIDLNDPVMRWLQEHLVSTSTVPSWLAIKTDLIDKFGGAELDTHKAQVKELLSYYAIKRTHALNWITARIQSAVTVPTWLVVKDEVITRFGDETFVMHKEEIRARLKSRVDAASDAAVESNASTELLDSDGARVGSIAGPSPEELVGMAAQVKEVVPQASDAVIRAVLERTQSTEATIATLMQLDQSGRLPTSPAAGGSSAAGGAASSNGSSGGDGGGAAATSSPARGARISPSASPVSVEWEQ